MINWHEVTPFSRMLAIVMFVGVIPVLFFYLGMQYQEMQNTKSVMQAYGFPRLEHYSKITPEPADMVATSTTAE